MNWVLFSGFWGSVSSVIAEIIAPKLKGWKKFLLVVLFCFVSGLLIGIANNSFTPLVYNFNEPTAVFAFIELIIQNTGIILAGAVTTYNLTWKKLFE